MTKREPLFELARFAPLAVTVIIALPVAAGLAGTVLPAFSYLPALGHPGFSLDGFRTVIAEPNVTRSAILSIWTGLAATLLSVALSLLILASGHGTRGWALMMRLLSPILSVPHAAAAYGLMVLVMPSGFISRLVSPELTGWQNPPDILFPNDPWGLALIAGLVAKEVPFLLLLLIAALGQADASRHMQMAGALGYGRISGFVHVLWPQLYRQVRFAVFAVLAFSATAVDVAIILGPATPTTLSVQLVRWMNDPDLTMRITASAAALMQLVLVVLLFAMWVCLERGLGGLVKRTAAGGRRYASDRRFVQAIRLIAWLLIVATLGGLALLALWSVAGLWPFPDALPRALSSKSWIQALPLLAEPLWATFQLGFLSAGFATVLCILALAAPSPGTRSIRTMQAALALPLILPQTAFLFGLQVAAAKAGLGYGILTLVWVHLLFVLPYVFLSLVPAWQALDPRFALVSQALGKSRTLTLLAIELPMLVRPVLTSFAVGFAVSAGLYLPTLLMGAGRVPTITTEAVALAAGGNRRTIGVYAFVQAVVPFAGFLLAFAVPAWLFRNRTALRAA